MKNQKSLTIATNIINNAFFPSPEEVAANNLIKAGYSETDISNMRQQLLKSIIPCQFGSEPILLKVLNAMKGYLYKNNTYTNAYK